MIFICDNCHFTFSRVGEVEFCPACDKPFVREAIKEEKDEYEKIHLTKINKNGTWSELRGI